MQCLTDGYTPMYLITPLLSNIQVFLISFIRNKIAVDTFIHNFSKLAINFLEQISWSSPKFKILLWTSPNCSVKNCTHLYPHLQSTNCPFYMRWPTLSVGIYFCLCQWHFVIVWMDRSLSSDSEQFSTHCRPFNSRLCELSVLAA